MLKLAIFQHDRCLRGGCPEGVAKHVKGMQERVQASPHPCCSQFQSLPFCLGRTQALDKPNGLRVARLRMCQSLDKTAACSFLLWPRTGRSDVQTNVIM